MELKNLEAFIAVAEASGFRRAAAHIGIRQSVLSRNVRDLEEELGVSLLERTRAGVSLTDAGREFLGTARSTLAELKFGARRAARAGKGAKGRLRLGIFASIASGFSNQAVRSFRERHPEVIFDITEGSPREHLLRIRERRLDLAFVTGESAFEGLRSEQLWTERVALAAPMSAPAQSNTVNWESLREERFIVSREEPGVEIFDWLTARLGLLGRHPDIVRCGVARESLLVLVGLGFGLTVVSEAAAGVSYPGVRFRFFQRDEDRLPFQAVWLDENDNPALRRFLALLRAMRDGRPLPNGPEG